MKHLFRYLYVFFGSLIVISFFIACGDNKSSNNQVVNPYPDNNGCPYGTYYSGGYCYNQNGQPINGFGYQNSINLRSNNYELKNLSISSGGYKNFLKKSLGICDRAYSSGGIYSCSYWSSGNGVLQIDMQSASTQATEVYVSFYAFLKNATSYWGYSLPSIKDFLYGMVGFPVWIDGGIAKNPVSLKMKVSLINDSKGFEARSFGDEQTGANLSLIQIQVLNGKIDDATVTYRASFEGQIFATGKFLRY